MAPLRAFLLAHRSLALLVLALALCAKAMVPAGYMFASSPDRVLMVTLCGDPSGAVHTAQIVIPGKAPASGYADAASKNSPCAFAGLSDVGLGGVDPLLLALAIAFILLLGFAPLRAPAPRTLAFFIPPSCGPPAAA